MTDIVHIVIINRAVKPLTGINKFQAPTLSEANPNPTRPRIPVKLRTMSWQGGQRCVGILNKVLTELNADLVSTPRSSPSRSRYHTAANVSQWSHIPPKNVDITWIVDEKHGKEGSTRSEDIFHFLRIFCQVEARERIRGFFFFGRLELEENTVGDDQEDSDDACSNANCATHSKLGDESSGSV